MSKRLLLSVALVLASAFPASFSAPPTIHVVGTTISNNRIDFVVGNAGSSGEQVCVQVLVRLSDGSTQLLTTSAVTVPGSATSTVGATAAGTIVEIVDDPQPVSF